MSPFLEHHFTEKYVCLELPHGFELSGEAEVDDLDAVSGLGHAQYVFGLWRKFECI